MATVNGVGEWIAPRVHRKTWSGLTTTDADGSWLDLPNASDRTVHVFGTFGVGGSVSIEGRNGGTGNGKVLTDPQGNALTFTTEAVEQIMENCLQIRPRVTAGDGSTDLTVVIVSHG